MAGLASYSQWIKADTVVDFFASLCFHTVMKAITWHPSLAIGVQQIDEQHQKLILIANAVIRLRRMEKSPALLKAAMHRLRDYTALHFSSEESYMARVGFPQLSSHQAETSPSPNR